MDIKPTDNSVNRDAANATKVTSGNQSAAQSATQGSTEAIDKLTLTDTVAQLIELQDSLSKVPDVRNEKVEAIRQALAEGLYEVDTDMLAENLVKSELE